LAARVPDRFVDQDALRCITFRGLDSLTELAASNSNNTRNPWHGRSFDTPRYITYGQADS